QRERRPLTELLDELLDDRTRALDTRAHPAVLEIHHEAFQPEIRCASLRIVAIADALDPPGDDDLGGRFRSAHEWWLGFQPPSGSDSRRPRPAPPCARPRRAAGRAAAGSTARPR